MRAVHRTAVAVSAAIVAVTGLAGSHVTTAIDPTTTPDGRLRFTAVGDIDSNTNSAATLSKIGSIAPDFNLTVGDLSLTRAGQEGVWCDFVKEKVGQKFPFELVSGNHESNGANGNINDFSACLPNQLPGAVGTYGRRWYVDVPQKDPLVRIVMVSPGLDYGAGNLSYAAGGADYQWTENAIDGARTAGIPWVIAGNHKPCITIGVYACQAGADITNLFLKKKVDLVLTGHEHMYGRTKQLTPKTGCTTFVPDSAYNASCVVDADADMRGGAGTVFLTSGTGGQPLRDVNVNDSELPYFAAYSGNNVNGTYGVTSFDLTPRKLTASFERGSGGTFTDSFVIDRDAPVTNQSPAASFTAGCDGLVCSFDGRASSDVDGTVDGYSWDFGDGTTGSGALTTHTYPSAGTYTARLTVTDDAGATGVSTRGVTTTAAGAPLAQDGFARTMATGLGAAETGGPWTTTGSSSRYAVSGGVGQLKYVAAGSTLDAGLGQVAAQDVDVAVTLSTDRTPGGSGLWTNLVARRTSAGYYLATAITQANGTIGLRIVRRIGTTDTALAGTVNTGVTVAPGEPVRVRFNVTGNGTTTLRARAWKVGTTEPTTWQRTATDTNTSLQVPGAVGINSYLSGSATNVPITLSIDDLLVTRP